MHCLRRTGVSHGKSHVVGYLQSSFFLTGGFGLVHDTTVYSGVLSMFQMVGVEERQRGREGRERGKVFGEGQ